MTISTAAADRALDSLLGSGHWTTVYVGLSTTLPADDGTGVTEHSGDAYARAAVTDDATHWPAASARQKSNGLDVPFPADPTATWGSPGWFFVTDTSSGPPTSLFVWGALASVVAIPAGPAPVFGAGALVLTVT